MGDFVSSQGAVVLLAPICQMDRSVTVLTQGSHGRVNKGEEVVALTFREGLVEPDEFGENNRTYDVSSNYSKTSLF